VDKAGMSVLMVTHNVAEAIGIADRLLLVSRRPASLIGDVPLDRPRRDRDRAWAEATRAALAAQHPDIIAL
jgi:NitT/TauT family transport system ATP-binding protein